ncbi:MAG TPA: hypothetical protein VK625_13510, partial [Flavitalea sp.]|nr:hypothetical protein [Flavitalea sp.]
MQLGHWVSANGDVVDLVEGDASFFEAEFYGQVREASPMFDSAESLLFGGSNQLTILKYGSRRIGVICVKT